MKRFIDLQKKMLFDESGMEGIEYMLVMLVALSVIAGVKAAGAVIKSKADSTVNEVIAGIGSI